MALNRAVWLAHLERTLAEDEAGGELATALVVLASVAGQDVPLSKDERHGAARGIVTAEEAAGGWPRTVSRSREPPTAIPGPERWSRRLYQTCDGCLQPFDVLRGPRERRGCPIDRLALEWVSSKARVEMKVEVRDRVAMDLVVHLQRPSQFVEGGGDSHGFTPESGELRADQLERLLHVALRDNAHVAGQRRPSRCGDPYGGKLPDDVPRCTLAAYRTVRLHAAGR